MTEATKNAPQVLEMIRKLADSAKLGTVFADPIVRDGLIVLPVAKVSGGGGGGGGNAGANGDEPGGAGGGFGLAAKPMGAFVIKNDKVSWLPAVDVKRIVLGGQIVAVVALCTIRTLLKERARRLGEV
jgi:uncharacterized spore protein YtfJ